MPGPVSDAYDPEFGTSSNAALVREGIGEVDILLTGILGDGLKDIVSVGAGASGKCRSLRLTERQMRLARFAIRRALESI
jgi:hypothetical protein